ncbi:MAG: hypothetical protein KAW92_10635 [Candidatus Cloacimonetes bacterium]|nr:hypothetical protein [Candidatus Cloacimonadota bacterium]
MKRIKRSRKLTEKEKLAKKLNYYNKKIRNLIVQRNNYMKVVKKAGLSAAKCSEKIDFYRNAINLLRKAVEVS